ncbi:hypothetical protein FHY13_004067 [Xanthomonas arboricola]|nr:hypothetical protein [Xanthomonas euroxanthea]MBB3815669.1 hypothetical protein [Xanthomonas euroxanthea]
MEEDIAIAGFMAMRECCMRLRTLRATDRLFAPAAGAGIAGGIVA